MLNVYIDYITKEDCMHRMSEFSNVNFSFDAQDLYKSEIIFGGPDIQQINNCPNLKWIQTMSAGVDMYMKGDFPKNIMLTNARGAYGTAISEHLLSMHLTLIKKLNEYYENQKQSTWKKLGTVQNVKGSTVLIIGFGDIGKNYAKLVKAMGAKVIGIKRTPIKLPPYADEIHTADNLENVLPIADVIAICTPGTNSTKNMINKKTIAQMKNGAIILNIGRGHIIDSDALCNALDSGKISGAGLDVTNPEPLPKNHKLWNYNNVIITPHISGNFHSNETKNTIVDIFFDNLHKFINKNELENAINLTLLQ